MGVATILVQYFKCTVQVKKQCSVSTVPKFNKQKNDQNI